MRSDLTAKSPGLYLRQRASGERRLSDSLAYRQGNIQKLWASDMRRPRPRLARAKSAVNLPVRKREEA